MHSDKLLKVIEAIRIAGYKPQPRDNGFKALCPVHNDTNPSLHIDDGDEGITFICRTNRCNVGQMLLSFNLTWDDMFYQSKQSPNYSNSYTKYAGKNNNGNTTIKTKDIPTDNHTSKREYDNLEDYTNFKGFPLQIFLDAGFKDKAGGYFVKDLDRFVRAFEFPTLNGTTYRLLENIDHKFRRQKGHKPCWYRLAEAVRTAKKEGLPLVICNGEPSTVIAQHCGFAATSICMNENGNLPDNLIIELKELYNGKILLALDNDDAGKQGAMKRLSALQDAGFEVQIIDFQSDKKGYDLADFCKDNPNDTWIEFTKLIPVKQEKMCIATNRQLIKIIEDAWDVIEQINTPPFLFQQNKKLVMIIEDDNICNVAQVDHDLLRGVLIRNASWVYFTEKSIREDKPSNDVLADMQVNIPKFIPELSMVISCPMFSAEGKLMNKKGYNKEIKAYYPKHKNVYINNYKSDAKLDDAVKGLSMLCDDLFINFPFTTKSDIANLIATILEQFIRPMLEDCRPFRCIDSATKGTGKGKIAQIIQLICFGSCVSPTGIPTGDREEWRKLIGSLLAVYPEVVLFDNVKTTINSQELEILATSTTYRTRVLGTGKMGDYLNSALWLFTGNNLSYAGDLSRRVVPIRMVAKQEDPWNRSEDQFKHPYILEWVKENRSLIVGHCLNIIQYWINQGMPKGEKRLGSFENWAKTLSGLMECVGFPGFLDNLAELHKTADTDRLPWVEFISEWYAYKGESPMRVGELLTLCNEKNLLSSILADFHPKSQESKLGKALAKKKDTIYDGKQIRIKTGSDPVTGVGNKTFYCLQKI